MPEVVAPYRLVLGRDIEGSHVEFEGKELLGIAGVSIGIGALGGEVGDVREATLILRIPLWRCQVQFDEGARPIALYEVPIPEGREDDEQEKILPIL